MGILVADRKFLGEIGGLDEGMEIYGGENVELGIRVSCSVCVCYCSIWNVLKVWFCFVFITRFGCVEEASK